MKWIIRLLWMITCASLLTTSCQPAPIESTPEVLPTASLPATSTAAPEPSPAPTMTPLPLVPNFSHIVLVVFQSKEFESVMGNIEMPYFNLLANTYATLTQHYAPSHRSLPNYLALTGGDTFDLNDECKDHDCAVNAPSLPDLIEQSGRTWKAYQDDMPEPCFTGNTPRYIRTHNPFIFFDSIRLDETRCRQSVVPLTQLDADLALNELPDMTFISPDICYSSQDCTLDLTDKWLQDLIKKIHPALYENNEPFLIIITWDKGENNGTCCGIPEPAGGRVATILISPQVRSSFQDSTRYTHYSILKTISASWNLPYLGHAADENTALITAPWK